MNTEINKLSDPTIVGPGTWWVTHMKGKDATNDELIEDFIDHMYFLAENFSCKKCRKHIQQYMETHPFDDLKNLRNEEGERIGMFKWSWLFHNAVNTRIGKPYVEWETAVEMFYKEQEVCSKNCEDAGNDHDDIPELQTSEPSEPSEFSTDLSDRKSKLAQGYFMSIGIPNTLKKNGIYTDTPDVSWINFATATN